MATTYRATLAEDQTVVHNFSTWQDINDLTHTITLVSGQHVEIEYTANIWNSENAGMDRFDRILIGSENVAQRGYKVVTNVNRRTHVNVFFAGVVGTDIDAGSQTIKAQVLNRSKIVSSTDSDVIIKAGDFKASLVVKVYD